MWPHASAPGKDWSTEITAAISYSPSLLSFLLQNRRCLYCQAKCSLLYHMAEERRRQVSLKPWKNNCNTSPACSLQCLAWADPVARSRSGGRGCLQPGPRSPVSHQCAVQRAETPRPPGSEGQSPRHTTGRCHRLWRGLFTSSSTHFVSLWDPLPF